MIRLRMTRVALYFDKLSTIVIFSPPPLGDGFLENGTRRPWVTGGEIRDQTGRRKPVGRFELCSSLTSG